MKSFSQIAAAWLAETEQTVKPSTLKLYRIAIEKLLAFRAELLEDPIDRATLIAFRQHRVRKTSVRTANRDLRAIRACLRWAEEMNPHFDIPSTRKLLLPEKSLGDQSLTRAEVKRVLKAAEAIDVDAARALLICSETGARISEVLALRWCDLDGDEVSIRDGKSENAVRSIPAPELCEALRAQRGTAGRQEPVCTRWGRPGAGKRLFPVIRKIFEAAGLEGGRTTHRFRHTLATELCELGAPLPAVQKLLGHAKPDLLLKTYAHGRSEAIKGAMSTLAEHRAQP